MDWVRKMSARGDQPEPDAVAPLLTEITLPDGGHALVDRATLEYMQSAAPQPTQTALDRILDQVVKVRVLDGGEADGRPFSDQVRIETDDASTLIDFRTALRIEDGPAGHCMCHGSQTLELLDRDDERVAVIGLHHGISIRWNAWKDDARLVDSRRLLEWIAAHGFRAPLEAFESDRRQEQAYREEYERWREAAPDAVRPLLDAAATESVESRDSLESVRGALAEAYPDEMQRALVLFAWFGRGQGPWSGFPSYESIVETFLLAMPTRLLIQAIEGGIATGTATEAHLEGAARYFAGWDFNRKKKKTNARRVPDPLKAQLLDHVLRCGHNENHWRAKDKLA